MRMGSGHRVAKVEKAILQTLGSYLISGFRFPLEGLVTVSHVQCTKDLRYAKVFISILGEPDAVKSSFALIEENVSDLQHHLAKHLLIKFQPRISVHLDSGQENALKVQKLLSQISS